MAKPEPTSKPPTLSELKRELNRIIKAITDKDDDEVRHEAFEDAARALAALRASSASNAKQPTAKKKETRCETVPEHFTCPISGELMRDPVVVASGQTYDRPFIQEWLNSGNRTCPRTQQVLSNTVLIPNDLVRRMILLWCTEHGITLPIVEAEQEEGLITRKELEKLNMLLSKFSMPSSTAEQKKAVKEIRFFTKQSRSFRAVIGDNPKVIPQLLSLLSVPGLNGDLEVQEDIVTTILNLSIHDSNKKIMGDNPQAIPLLIDALNAGTMEARSNSAAALFSLSTLNTNRLRIGELGAMKYLTELLEHGSPMAKKDAGSAIFSLCLAPENRVRAVREGVVGIVLTSISDKLLVAESLAILALLSSDQEAVDEICAIGGIPCLLGILRECSCARNKENAVVVLYAVCMCDRTKLREIGEEENLNRTISQLAQTGTSRARRKATGILDRWKRTSGGTHYSC